MVAGYDQHCNGGYNDLYIYPSGRTVSPHPAVPEHRRSWLSWSLPEQYGANIANNINECNYRYMVTGYDQHCNGGYNDLYIYPGSGTVCCCGNDGYCDHYADHSNVYCDWSALSEFYCTVAAWYF